jgi:hypothetical protein
MFKGAYPVMGLGLWQGRGIIGESSALNKPSGFPVGVRNPRIHMAGSR